MEDLPEIFIPNLKVASKTIVGKRDFTSGMVLVILVTGLYILASLVYIYMKKWVLPSLGLIRPLYTH